MSDECFTTSRRQPQQMGDDECGISHLIALSDKWINYMKLELVTCDTTEYVGSNGYKKI